ncbi:MAG: MotA/TolQ/ExbB proton channel family protein [Candidatus Aureabacteria bacterium]|nr:MotA/TolQ/ExbB proton channel family protein [Candidatus Auribacterota bacterium]
MWEWFKAGGTIMWPLLILSLASWSVIFERFFVFWIEFKRTRRLAKKIEDTAANQSEIDAMIETNHCAMAKVLTTVHAHVQLSKEDNLILTRTKLKEEIAYLQRGLTLLEVCASVSPLLGLLGTVVGIVQVFSVISKAGTGDAAILSGGISTALNTTVFGLIIAIPSAITFSFFERRIDVLIQVIEKYVVQLLTTYYSGR